MVHIHILVADGGTAVGLDGQHGTAVERIAPGMDFAGFGGGIVNKGQTTLSNVSVMGNVADDGGGIANFSTMTLTNSKVADNASLTSDGGGIYNEGSCQ